MKPNLQINMANRLNVSSICRAAHDFTKSAINCFTLLQLFASFVFGPDFNKHSIGEKSKQKSCVVAFIVIFWNIIPHKTTPGTKWGLSAFFVVFARFWVKHYQQRAKDNFYMPMIHYLIPYTCKLLCDICAIHLDLCHNDVVRTLLFIWN